MISIIYRSLIAAFLHFLIDFLKFCFVGENLKYLAQLNWLRPHHLEPLCLCFWSYYYIETIMLNYFLLQMIRIQFVFFHPLISFLIEYFLHVIVEQIHHLTIWALLIANQSLKHSGLLKSSSNFGNSKRYSYQFQIDWLVCYNYYTAYLDTEL